LFRTKAGIFIRQAASNRDRSRLLVEYVSCFGPDDRRLYDHLGNEHE
jgi:hypothetical protein